jgi:alpha-tubulin suppressor-like RCC1 family protein
MAAHVGMRARAFIVAAVAAAALAGCVPSGGGSASGSTTTTSPPVATLAEIAVGGTNTCARFDDGAVKCWGSNSFKQLGVDQSVSSGSTVPITVPLPHSASAIDLGNGFGCVATTAGGVDCWGKNLWGALGNGTYDGSSGTGQLPSSVVGAPAGVTGVSAGGQHACASTALGAAVCWGDNAVRQLGDTGNPYSSFRTTPWDVASLSSGVSQLELGGATSCALVDGDGVKCWGGNTAGKVDAADTAGGIGLPRTVAGLGSGVTSLANGSFSAACAVQSGEVKCWGNNIYGVLGTGVAYPTLNKSLPVTVSGITNAVSVVGGYQHFCALLSDTTVKCWGRGDSGQLGDGNIYPDTGASSGNPTPVVVSGLTGVKQLVTGSEANHTCAVLFDDTVRCWGYNGHGELGDGTTTSSASPVSVKGL